MLCPAMVSSSSKYPTYLEKRYEGLYAIGISMECILSATQFNQMMPNDYTVGPFSLGQLGVDLFNSKCWKLVFRAFPFMGMFD